MPEVTIVNIKHKTFVLDDEQLLKLVRKDDFKYMFVPVVVYNRKSAGKHDLTSPPSMVTYHDRQPFSLYELGTSMAILRNYMGPAFVKEDLASAKKAFKVLKQLASQCHERIIADLCSLVVLQEIKNLPNDGHLVVFIEKSASDKMLGRLGSLHLNLERVTICFLVFAPSDLMTAVMSYQTGKLHFDIHRLMSSELGEPLGPYPGDSEDSLIQTYFYKPMSAPEGGGEYRPMRLDLFAQGLLRDKIEERMENVRKILNHKSPDHEFGIGSDPRLMLPYGSRELDAFLFKQEREIRDVLMDYRRE